MKQTSKAQPTSYKDFLQLINKTKSNKNQQQSNSTSTYANNNAYKIK